MQDSHGATEDVEIHEVVVEPTKLRGGEVHHRALRSSGARDAESGERGGKNVLSWQLWEWNMVIEDVDHGGQRHTNVVLQVLSSPLWPQAVAAIGVVLFGVWQGVDPNEILLMVFTCLAFYFAVIFFGLQQILLTEPTNPYGNPLLSFPQGSVCSLTRVLQHLRYDRVLSGPSTPLCIHPHHI